MASDFIFIRDLKPDQKSVNVRFIVLEVGSSITTKDKHKLRTCKVADKTAAVTFSVWAEIGDEIQTADILQLTKGYTKEFNACMTLYSGRGSELTKIGEFCFPFVEDPNMSKANPEVRQKMMLPEHGGPKKPNGEQSEKPPHSGGNLSSHRPRSGSTHGPPPLMGSHGHHHGGLPNAPPSPIIHASQPSYPMSQQVPQQIPNQFGASLPPANPSMQHHRMPTPNHSLPAYHGVGPQGGGVRLPLNRH